MGNRLLIGNLSMETTESQLEEVFSQAGTVRLVTLVIDPRTERKKGFAFVEMSCVRQAAEAIKQLNGTEVHGRAITINHAETKKRQSPFSFITRWMNADKM